MIQLGVPVPVGGKKEALIEKVVRTVWGVRTKEELEREEARKNTVKLAREGKSEVINARC